MYKFEAELTSTVQKNTDVDKNRSCSLHWERHHTSC